MSVERHLAHECNAHEASKHLGGEAINEQGRYPSLSVALSSQDWQVYLMNELTVENLISLTLMVRLG